MRRALPALLAAALPLLAGCGLGGGAGSVVEAELADLRAGRVDQAYDRTSADYRRSVSRAQFQDLVDRHPTLGHNREARFPDRSTSLINDTARFRGTLTAADGREEFVFIGLVRDPQKGGVWEINQLDFLARWER